MYKIYSKHFVLPPGRTKKLLRIMKLTTLLLFMAFMQVSASSLAQKVTLTVNKAPLTTVLTQIEKQTGYDFAITGEILEQAKPVTINVKNEDLADVLKEIFADQPLNYSIEDRSIVISQKRITVQDRIRNILNSTAIEVTGQIVDEQKRPVSGATVSVKNTGNATITDAKGMFYLKNVDDKATIVVTFIGFERNELPVNHDMGIIQLVVAHSKLDEVQVMAYGQTSQRLSTGNITSVSSKEIEKQPVDNPLLALENRVPGLQITQNTGLPGSGVTVRVQGINSLQNGNDALYVIDGVPVSSQLLPGIIGIQGSSGGLLLNGATPNGNPLSFINPDEIESISVLKDADATSIYGSRAANGAILITTKKGKSGQTKVDLNLRQGVGQVAHFVPMLNTQQYLAMRHQAYKNDNITTIPSNANDINGVWDTTRYTDWQKTLLGGNANYTDINTDISGGNANTQFLVGGNFNRQTTVFPDNFADSKGSLHFNINNVSSNRKFKIQFSGSYLVDNNHLPVSDLTIYGVQLAPDAPALYKPDGTLNWQPNTAGSSTWTNPLSYTLVKYNNKTSNLIGNGVISYEIVKQLVLSTNLGYTNLRSDQTLLTPLDSYAPEIRPNRQSSAILGNNNSSSWIIEPQLAYKTSIGKGIFDGLIGSSIQRNNDLDYQFVALGYTSDINLGDVGSAGSLVKNYSASSEYKYFGVFARLNYNYDDRYVLNLAARRDGSSRFGPTEQFHNFYSIGAAWIFSNESFIKNAIRFMSFGKLRASYGTTGNDQIGDYQFLSVYSYNANIQVPYQGVNPLAPSNLPNPYLQWEETKKMQFGADLGFFKDRILLTLNYVHNRSSNELLSYSLPIITGFGTILENFPATIQNTALEFSLNSTNVKTSDFSWSTNLNFTVPRNKLVAFPGIENSTYSGVLKVGQPITSIRVFHMLGVDPVTGRYEFQSATDQFNPTVDDRTKFVNLSPTFYGGFGNTFRYKSISLDVFFSFVRQNGLNFEFGNFVPGRRSFNQPTYVLNAWQSPGQVTTVEKYNSNLTLGGSYFNAKTSDAAYADASFARLKNAVISWSLPNNWISRAGLKDCELFVQGQNLWTLTKYKGMDPETLSSTTLPPLRTIAIGIKAHL